MKIRYLEVVQTLVLPLPTWVPLDKLLFLTKPQIPHLQNGYLSHSIAWRFTWEKVHQALNLVPGWWQYSVNGLASVTAKALSDHLKRCDSSFPQFSIEILLPFSIPLLLRKSLQIMFFFFVCRKKNNTANHNP